MPAVQSASLPPPAKSDRHPRVLIVGAVANPKRRVRVSETCHTGKSAVPLCTGRLQCRSAPPVESLAVEPVLLLLFEFRKVFKRHRFPEPHATIGDQCSFGR